MFEIFSCQANAKMGLFLAALLPLLLTIGCGSKDMLAVQGSVTYRGKPLKDGRIGFYPEKGRPAFAEIHDGKFVLSTFEPGDGAMIGSYRITIHCDALSNPKDAFSKQISLIPVRYQKQETSGLTAEVKPGADNDFSFELTD